MQNYRHQSRSKFEFNRTSEYYKKFRKAYFNVNSLYYFHKQTKMTSTRYYHQNKQRSLEMCFPSDRACQFCFGKYVLILCLSLLISFNYVINTCSHWQGSWVDKVLRLVKLKVTKFKGLFLFLFFNIVNITSISSFNLNSLYWILITFICKFLCFDVYIFWYLLNLIIYFI